MTMRSAIGRAAEWLVWVLVTTAGVGTAHAQGLGRGISSQVLWVEPGSGVLPVVAGAAAPPGGSSAAGMALQYYRRPLGVRLPGHSRDQWVVDDAVTADMWWHVGVADRFVLGAVIPLVLWQDGEGAAPLVTAPEERAAHGLAASAVGDLRFWASAQLWGQRGVVHDRRGPALALRLTVAVPSGDEENFAGETGVVVAPSALLDWRSAAVDGALRAGVRLRSGAKAVLADADVGNQFSGMGGITGHFAEDRVLISTFAAVLAEMDDWRRMGVEWAGAVGTRGPSGVTAWLSAALGGSSARHPVLGIPQFRCGVVLQYTPGTATIPDALF